jgi:hypothetical protein
MSLDRSDALRAADERSGPLHPRILGPLAGLTAGLVAFALGEVTLDWFPPEYVPQMLSGAEVMKPTVKTMAVADAKNAALAFAFLGAFLGSFLGFAGLLSRADRPRKWNGPLAGLLLGIVFGAALPLLLVVPYSRLQQYELSPDDMVVPLLLHSLYWGTLGAVGGLAFAIGSGSSRRGRLALLGFVGACLGAGIYEVVASMIDPLAATTEAVSKSWPTRLLARVLAGLGTGAVIGLVGIDSHVAAVTKTPGAAGAGPESKASSGAD